MADIDYGKIIRRSYDITKKHKWLWVYGLVLAVMGGGSGGSGSGGGSSSSINDIPKNIPKDLPEKTSYVLGNATSYFKDWFQSVSVSTWVFIVLAFILTILLWIVITAVIKNWAKGGLITGLSDAHQGKDMTLLSTSPSGIKSIKPLFIYSLVTSLVAFGLIFSVIVIGVFGYFLFSFSESLQILWMGAGSILGVMTIIVIIVVFVMVSIYADRLIVLKGYTPHEAWKKGLSLSRSSFLNTVLMGVINSGIGCFAGCGFFIVLLVVLGIPAIILGVLLTKEISAPLNFITIPSLLFLLIVFIYVNYLFKALLTVFNYSNWNLFFEEVWRQEKKI